MSWNFNDEFSRELITISSPFRSCPFEPSFWRASDCGLIETSKANQGELIAGQCVGPFRLLQRLGRGGQADVWRALRFEPTMMEVALKLLPERGQDPRKIAQLRREAERGLRLGDAGPGLLRALAFGEADGHWFMAMPLVVGTTLARIISARRSYVLGHDAHEHADHALATLPEEQYQLAIVGLIAFVARSLADAHAARIVHRDVKPSNILVPKEYRRGAFLCDFGLGRDLDIATPEQLLDGAGSPHYMAPERLLKSAAVDEYRCEVFALGVTLYEAITLTLPSAIPDGMPRSDWAELLAASEPIPPSAFRPEIDPRIESVVMRAIDRDPLKRHASAYGLAIELETIVRTAKAKPEPARHARRY